MTTELVSRRTVVVSWLLTSLCLRYGVAKPSVWLCRKACKRRQFNGFGSDYPLNLTCFGFQYWGAVEDLSVSWFFVVHSLFFCSLDEVFRSCLRSRGNIAGSWNDLDRGFLISNHWRSSLSRSRAWNCVPFRTCWTVPLTATSSARCRARSLVGPALQVLAEPEHSSAPHWRTSGSSNSGDLSACSTDSSNTKAHDGWAS